MEYHAVIIGGGASGIFAAITCAATNQGASVLVLEQSAQLLSKVKISGGGRCNVTHACFDIKQLITSYPRGGKELLGPFHTFSTQDMVDWLQARGVCLKAEADGRMFPITDSSETIIKALLSAAEDADVKIRTLAKVIEVTKEENNFVVTLKSGESLKCRHLMLATGGTAGGHLLAKELGHTIVELVPSLFTFNVPSSPFHALSGVSIDDAVVRLPQFKTEQRGPLLITHFGFSGPAVLKLSAWAARQLHDANYETTIQIDWLPSLSRKELEERFKQRREEGSKKGIAKDLPFSLPNQLAKAFLDLCHIPHDLLWNQLTKSQRDALIHLLKEGGYRLMGKTTNKHEFVTCGGVKLSQVDFKTMESKIVPHLYFGGEVLDIDGITGGFNFQAAWTTGYIAGRSMARTS